MDIIKGNINFNFATRMLVIIETAHHLISPIAISTTPLIKAEQYIFTIV